MPLRDVLAALATVAVFGLAFVAIKVGVGEMPPLMLTALRFFFAAIPAVMVVRPPKAPVLTVVAFGVALGVGLFGLIFFAIAQGMPAGLASVVVQLQVFFTMALAWVVVGERPDRWQIGGGTVAFAGMGLIASLHVGTATMVPLVMVLGAAACWAVANLIAKQAGTADRLALVVWGSLAAPPPLILLSLAVDGPERVWKALSEPTWPGVLSVAFMAYPATVMAFSLWGWLLSRHPAATVAPFALLIPVFGLVGTSLAFGETLGPVEIVASGLIMVGLLIGMTGRRAARG